MLKLWFKLCVVLFICAAAIAQDNKNEEDFDDPWYKDYDQWYQDELDKMETDDSKDVKESGKPLDDDFNSSSLLDDYQIEDNRSVENDDNEEDIPASEVKQPENIDKIVKDANELSNKVDSKMEISIEKNNSDDIKNKLDQILDAPNLDTSADSDPIDLDLQTLFDSIKKIQAENKKEEDTVKEDIVDDMLDKSDTNEVLDYEDKYDRPFHEGVVLQMRENEVDDMEQDSSLVNDNNSTEKVEKKIEEIIPYGLDGLEAEATETENKVTEAVKQEVDTKTESNQIKPEPLKQYSNDELPKLINQLVKNNGDDLNVTSSKFNLNVDVNYITINYNENIAVVSPRYPDNYLPENNIFDYMLQGDGMGIELNVTEVNINGGANDFLLIKPGGVDSTGSDGIVFSYNINEERRFRFHEVDRLFVRFQTHSSQPVSGFLGWSFSIRLLGPRPNPPEPAPEPEPTVPVPRYSYSRFFGGVTPQDFQDIREDFRNIIADMADMYVDEHDIGRGEMPISEVVNITHVSVCNINWPEYDNCAAITFAVPLKYDEEEQDRYGHRLNSADLKDMWDSYSTLEQFARRISDLGLSDFNKPNDGRALMLWLLVGTACLCMAVGIAFSLWRWNCFQNYSRMSHYSDTESVVSQKAAGLYPTPYQDLPALYAQPYNQITTADDPSAVDMGFANKSFARYDLFDADFDETPHRMSGRSDKYTTDV